LEKFDLDGHNLGTIIPLTLKKTSCAQTASPAQISLNFQFHPEKSNFDNKTWFGNPGAYCLRLWPLQYVGLSYPVVLWGRSSKAKPQALRAKSEAETNTQLTSFDSSASEKQLFIDLAQIIDSIHSGFRS